MSSRPTTTNGHDEGAIRILGARAHNLKNVDVDIPHGQFIVITGVSGSGKSSLAFDTLYAEGQRQYVESLSVYARQYLHQLERPDVDQILGLQPTICIDQRPGRTNPRSTVATVTEIYDYLRLLYARLGLPHCPTCGAPIDQQPPERIHEQVMAMPEETRMMILAPLVRGKKGQHRDHISRVRKAGMMRVRIDGIVHHLDELPELDPKKKHTIEAVVDRIIVREKNRDRIGESLRLALSHGEGRVMTTSFDPDPNDPEGRGGRWVDRLFSTQYSCTDCGVNLEEVEPRTFSFNSPQGACPVCDGMGRQEEFDPEMVLADLSRSIADGAVVPMKSCTAAAQRKFSEVIAPFLAASGHDENTPVEEFGDNCIHSFIYGDDKEFIGLLMLLEKEYATTKNKKRRTQLEMFRGPVICQACAGSRLCQEARAVTIDGKSIDQLVAMNMSETLRFIRSLQFDSEVEQIAEPLVSEIIHRLEFLVKVGVDYLTLNRPAETLSGGELQRVRLAKCIGSGLVGVCYVLDEPTIGLHPTDNSRLIGALRELQQAGNTVLVVEHDESMMRQADHLIDVGPSAGFRGGNIVARGTPQQVGDNPDSPTGRYLSGKDQIKIPSRRRRITKSRSLLLSGASINNLKHIDVQIPLEALVCITGVSGSGKSSLINETLAPAMLRRLGVVAPKPGPLKSLRGVHQIDRVIAIDQIPLGRTPRSNAATYTGLYDEVRKVFAQTRGAKQRGFGASRFSFNVKGGRCESCLGHGQQKIEMNFLPDLYVTCDVCNGTRFNRQTLTVAYRGKSVADVLDMAIDEAVDFFENFENIHRILSALQDVGLGYLPLGQPSTTLSGGEAQRVKLANHLAAADAGKTLYLLDEPTTGLHFDDIRRLLDVLGRLVDRGNSVLVIEHNLDVIKCADWVIDLGPAGGDAGGRVVATGDPETLAKVDESRTGAALRSLPAWPPGAKNGFFK